MQKVTPTTFLLLLGGLAAGFIIAKAELLHEAYKQWHANTKGMVELRYSSDCKSWHNMTQTFTDYVGSLYADVKPPFFLELQSGGHAFQFLLNSDGVSLAPDRMYRMRDDTMVVLTGESDVQEWRVPKNNNFVQRFITDLGEMGRTSKPNLEFFDHENAVSFLYRPQNSDVVHPCGFLNARLHCDISEAELADADELRRQACSDIDTFFASAKGLADLAAHCSTPFAVKPNRIVIKTLCQNFLAVPLKKGP